MGITTSKGSVATVTFSTPQEIIINKDDDSITAWQGGTWNINNVSGTVSLPAGAATAANQSTANTSLSNILTELQAKTEPADTQIVKIASASTSGTIDADGEYVEIDCSSGLNTVIAKLNGTMTGGVISFQGFVHSTWDTAYGINLTNLEGAPKSGYDFSEFPGTALLAIAAAGYKKIRIYGNLFVGSVDVELSASTGTSVITSIMDYVYVKMSGSDSLQTKIVDGSDISRIATVSTDGAIKTDPAKYSIRIDEASSTVTYTGRAAAGSSEGSAVWQITKMAISGTVTSVTFADGNTDFDNNWTNRASLSYS